MSFRSFTRMEYQAKSRPSFSSWRSPSSPAGPQCAKENERVGPLTTKVVRVVCAALVVATVASGQTSGRRLTTIDAIRRFSGYFHLQTVVLRGELVEVAAGRAGNGTTRPGGGAVDVSSTGQRLALRGGESEMQVMLDGVNPIEGPV